MRATARRAIADVQLKQFVGGFTVSKDLGRRSAMAEAFGDRADAVRTLAGAIKQHTLDHLDWYLEQFVERAEGVGAKVHFAVDGKRANEICLEIAKRNGCRLCVKSKSMVTEETGLVPELEVAGIETVETDLGEFIIQLDHDAPSHIVAPMIHKDRTAVGRAFARELGVPYTDEPAKLAEIARSHLREKYRKADLGISGANFLVAETGSVVLCTNEGNGRFCTSGPRVHVVMAGIEKVSPRMEHLSVMLKVLARSATAQAMTVYTNIVTGPRRGDEVQGPEEVHIILVDGGRTRVLEAETRELLRCIRCGACLNACPVYRAVGGHSYGAVYSGPIGAAITPLLKGLENYPDLPKASSLCGACFEACPVKIDIPRQLIRLRERMVRGRVTGFWARAGYRVWAAVLGRRWSYEVAARLNRVLMRGMGEGGWIVKGPGPVKGWTSQRDMRVPGGESFREWWEERAAEQQNSRAADRTEANSRGAAWPGGRA